MLLSFAWISLSKCLLSLALPVVILLIRSLVLVILLVSRVSAFECVWFWFCVDFWVLGRKVTIVFLNFFCVYICVCLCMARVFGLIFELDLKLS